MIGSVRQLTVVGLAAVALAAADLPPLPDVGEAHERHQILRECKVPAQVVVLPPMVEPDFIDCSNRYYKPTASKAGDRLSTMLGETVSVKRIAIAEGFLRAYEIDVKTERGDRVALLCGDKLTHCYKRGEVVKKDSRKEQK